jgi:putative DNA primase/helicase
MEAIMDFSQIDWKMVLPNFGIHPSFLKNKHGPCPLCRGAISDASKSKHNGRKRFRFDDKGTGRWICSTCGPGNGLTLIRKFTGLPDREIFKAIEKYAAGSGVAIDFNSTIPPKIFSKAFTAEEVECHRKKLRVAWKESKELDYQDSVCKYLLDRVPRLDLSKVSKEIRMHPGMPFWEMDENDLPIKKGYFPVMLARVVDGEGKPITLHRTYLTKEGGKAPFDMVKKQMPGLRKLEGEAIRLHQVPSSRVLGVCEGIETGYAIVAATRYRINVWSLLNCGNLAKADIPQGMFDKVIIFADHDEIDQLKGYRPGEHYANLLRKKLQEKGVAVEIKMPKQVGEDFCDVWYECCKASDIT